MWKKNNQDPLKYLAQIMVFLTFAFLSPLEIPPQ